jgi:hypothetical protein
MRDFTIVELGEKATARAARAHIRATLREQLDDALLVSPRGTVQRRCARACSNPHFKFTTAHVRSEALQRVRRASI